MSIPELVIRDGDLTFFFSTEKRDEDYRHEIAILDTTFLNGEKEGASTVLRFVPHADLISLRDWLTEHIDLIEKIKHASRFKLPL